MPPRLGAHMSIAGGVDKAVERAGSAGCEALQLFTRSTGQWAARPLAAAEIARFRRGVKRLGLRPVLVHDSYLINLASPERALWRRSVAALVDEIDRCEALGASYLVVHPGAHMGSGEEAGIDRIARGLDRIHAARPRARVRVLLETTAGQGTTLGHRFEQLAAVIRRVDDPERVGVCADTAHLYAAGYDIGTAEGWRRTWEAFDAVLGLERLAALHVNDSKRPLGSRVDRHEHIGRGAIPFGAFVRLMNDPAFDGLPAVLETPKGRDLVEDRENLAVLRALAGRRRAPSRSLAERWRADARREAAG
ncbi:MAG: deoxyribonuclease IV [Acidobacteria bacterium]|nr:MAG: deoxyribonuclease IV [Acidobacteriota bacterium]